MNDTPSKIAVVTGAGTGIGRAVSIALSESGFTVILSGRRREPLDETAGVIEKEGHRCLVVPTDVTDEGSVRSLFDQLEVGEPTRRAIGPQAVAARGQAHAPCPSTSFAFIQ